MKNFRNRFCGISALVLSVMMTAVLLTACGSSGTALFKSGSSEAAYSADSSDYGSAAGTRTAMFASPAAETTAASYENGNGTSGSGEIPEENTSDPARKLIVTKNFEVETQDFDALLVQIETKAAALGGYIETSEVNGGTTSPVPLSEEENSDSLYYTKEDEQRLIRQEERTANYVVRIPAEKLDEFTDAVKSASNVVNESMTTEDITLQYVDTDARRIALEKEESRLLDMMDQAQNVDEMIQIENALANVDSELQQIKSQLKLYDSQVQYSTVHINVTETAVYTQQTRGLSWNERIAKGFEGGVQQFVHSMQNLSIAIVSNFLMVIYWLIILLLILLLIRFLIFLFRLFFPKRPKQQRMMPPAGQYGGTPGPAPQNGGKQKKHRFFGKKKQGAGSGNAASVPQAGSGPAAGPASQPAAAPQPTVPENQQSGQGMSQSQQGMSQGQPGMNPDQQTAPASDVNRPNGDSGQN